MDNDIIPIGVHRFVEATESNISGLEEWFVSQQQLSSWAGPGVSHPLQKTDIVEVIGLYQNTSFCLLSRKNELLGFGQFYQRLNRQHLCRVAVNPKSRGLGLGTFLVKKLIEQARFVETDCEMSLFVNKDNPVALHCYQTLGFSIQPYPQKPPTGIELCHYMVL